MAGWDNIGGPGQGMGGQGMGGQGMGGPDPPPPGAGFGFVPSAPPPYDPSSFTDPLFHYATTIVSPRHRDIVHQLASQGHIRSRNVISAMMCFDLNFDGGNYYTGGSMEYETELLKKYAKTLDIFADFIPQGTKGLDITDFEFEHYESIALTILFGPLGSLLQVTEEYSIIENPTAIEGYLRAQGRLITVYDKNQSNWKRGYPERGPYSFALVDNVPEAKAINHTLTDGAIIVACFEYKIWQKSGGGDYRMLKEWARPGVASSQRTNSSGGCCLMF